MLAGGPALAFPVIENYTPRDFESFKQFLASSSSSKIAMRFLDTHTLQFVPDSEAHLAENQYAILSHRWGTDKDEVSFEDVLASADSSPADFSHRKGFGKLKGFCKVASSKNYRYGWVDTCCINKKDVVELQEAINSMYRWYENSKLCIVYLQDVPQKQLTDSEWFERGWTLQELIAPGAITFFDREWSPIGTKTNLVLELSRKTRIPEEIINNKIKPFACSVAQRMSWAANRITTREEDRAYSLMGLFDIYMPIIYGQRERAFLKLQQEIIHDSRHSRDESIFAWDMEFPGNTSVYSGLFSPSPLAYANCRDIIQTSGSRGILEQTGELSIWSSMFPYSPGIYFATLNCINRACPESRVYIMIGNTSTEGEFVRVRDAKKLSRGLVQPDDLTQFQERQIRVSVTPTQPPVNIFNGFWLRTLQPPGHDECQTTLISNCQPPEADYVCQHEYDQGVAGIVHIDPRNSANHSRWSQIHWITFSFDRDFNPILWLADGKHSRRLQNAFEQAVASGTGSLECQRIMKTCKKATERSWPSNWEDMEEVRPGENGMRPSRRDQVWPKGALTMTVDRKQGIHEKLINNLNLQVSVQLQHYLNSSTTNIWVVDIVDIGGTSPEERDRQSRERVNRLEKKAYWKGVRKWCVCILIIGLIFIISLAAGHVIE